MMFSVSETGKIEKLLSINITDLKEIHVVNNINSKTMLPEEMELSIEPTEQTSFDVQVEESVCKDENDLITESEELRNSRSHEKYTSSRPRYYRYSKMSVKICKKRYRGQG